MTEAVLHTNRGDIRLTLFDNQAPKTVANFTGLADGSKEWVDPKTGRMEAFNGRKDFEGMYERGMSAFNERNLASDFETAIDTHGNASILDRRWLVDARPLPDASIPSALPPP